MGSRRSKSIRSGSSHGHHDQNSRTTTVESAMTLSCNDTEQPIEAVLMLPEPMLPEPEPDPRSHAASAFFQHVDGECFTNDPVELPAGNAEIQQAVQVEDLRRQLDGKNELISALVGELEQVVEQLDRVKRSGTIRTTSGSAMVGLPANLVDDHQQVLGGLQRVVQEWEDLRAASTLGRIESELAELRMLVATGVGRGEAHAERQPAADDLDSVLSRLAIGRNTEPTEEARPTISAMDDARRRLFAEENPDAPASDGPASDTSDSGVEDVANVLDGIASPEPMDLAMATLDDLKRACAERDTYIVRVTRCLRAKRAVALPTNWDEIAGVPAELRQHVDYLASRLEEQVRLAEVEISLERARLSRERTDVDAERTVMEKHLKRLGVSSLDDLEDVTVSAGTSADRRWMRFLGVNR